MILILIAGETKADSARGRDAVVETVDLIELNHYIDHFDQVIFCRWSPDYRRYDVMAWVITDQSNPRRPTRDYARGDYVVRWFDWNVVRYREVRSKLFRETWTSRDPERANKLLLEEKFRIGLRKPVGL